MILCKQWAAMDELTRTVNHLSLFGTQEHVLTWIEELERRREEMRVAADEEELQGFPGGNMTYMKYKRDWEGHTWVPVWRYVTDWTEGEG